MLKQVSLNLGILGYLSQIKSVGSSAWKSKRDADTRFLIYSQGRSGSHALVELLSSHPKIYADGSLIGYPAISPMAYINYRSRLGGHDCYGFKIKPYHIDRQKIAKTEFFDSLTQDGWKLIYLHRRNKLRQAISNSYANAIGSGHVQKDAKTKAVRLQLDPQKVIGGIQNRLASAAEESELMNRYPHFSICYEDDLLPQNQHESLMVRLFDWLGVDPHRPSTDLKPSTPKNLSDFIENYQELVSELGKAGLEEFVE